MFGNHPTTNCRDARRASSRQKNTTTNCRDARRASLHNKKTRQKNNCQTMYKKLDKTNWNRSEHFEFFNDFDEPHIGITTEVDCSKAYKICKENSISFFLYCHYKAIMAVNKIDEFRYRIKDNDVIIFDRTHVTTTIIRNDNTFSFSFIPFAPTFNEFTDLAKIEIDKIQKSSGLGQTKNSERLDVIHFSTVPWIKFSAVSLARNYKYKDGIPKIAFGKYFKKNEKLLMPVYISVHHGLMDAFHVSEYLKLLEQFMNVDYV